MFHQFFQRDKADSIVLDVDVLSAFTAGLVRCFHIDGLNQLSEHIRVDFLDSILSRLTSLVAVRLSSVYSAKVSVVVIWG